MKRLLWLLALFATVCVLAGCGNGGDNASSTAPSRQSPPSQLLTPMENAQQPLPGLDMADFTDFFRYYFRPPYFSPLHDPFQLHRL